MFSVILKFLRKAYFHPAGVKKNIRIHKSLSDIFFVFLKKKCNFASENNND